MTDGRRQFTFEAGTKLAEAPVCEGCGGTLKRKNRRFCSRKCSNSSPERREISRLSQIEIRGRGRSEAKASGLKHYFTGKPCRHGHVDKRLVSSSMCCTCNRLAAQRLLAADRESQNARKGQWRQNNKDRLNVTVAARRAENPDKMKTLRKIWNVKYRDQIRAWVAADANANPEKYRSKARNRRALRKAAAGKHTAEDIKDIYRLQRGCCAYCRCGLGDDYHVDHIKPISRKGTNWRRNLQILCQPCNQEKFCKDPIDFARERGLLL